MVFVNPFDHEHPISIHHEEVVIPLLQSGTTLFLVSSTPTPYELNTCPHIILTFDTEWNPHTVTLSATRSEEAAIRICAEEDGNHPGQKQISSLFSMPEMAESLKQQRRISVIDIEERKTFASKERHPVITKETLSERWNIGLVQAQQTLKVTTQRGVRSAILPLSRRYCTDRMYTAKKLWGKKFYTDALFGRVKSISYNTCAQIFANESYFVKAYPMEKKSQAGQALRQFIRDFGTPEQLTSDGAAEQTGPKTEFMKNVRKSEIDHHISEAYRPQQKRAEAAIREVKRRWFRQMSRRRVPKRLCDYGIVWVCKVMSLTSNSSFNLDRRAPIEQITGETPDKSEYVDFSFYDWVWYRDNAGVGDNMFGHWLGVSHRIGNLMSFWILTPNGRVISRTTVQQVTNLELQTNEVKQRCTEYDVRIKELLKNEDHVILADDEERTLQDWDDYTEDNDPEFAEEYNQLISDFMIPEADETFTPDTFDDK